MVMDRSVRKRRAALSHNLFLTILLMLRSGGCMHMSAQLVQLKYLIDSIDLTRRDRFDLELLISNLLPDYQFASTYSDPLDSYTSLQG